MREIMYNGSKVYWSAQLGRHNKHKYTLIISNKIGIIWSDYSVRGANILPGKKFFHLRTVIIAEIIVICWKKG